MAVPGRRIAARRRLDAIVPAPRDAAAGLLGAAAIRATAFVDDGYFPTAWASRPSWACRSGHRDQRAPAPLVEGLFQGGKGRRLGGRPR